MKFMFSLIALNFIFIQGLWSQSEGRRLGSRKPQIIRAPISEVYAPLGYDDNDVVQVVIEGYFSDDCYRVKQVLPDIRVSQRKINLEVFAYRVPGNCAPKKTAYMRVVDLDQLPLGRYLITHSQHQERPGVQSTLLEIKRATRSERDDFPYAPVSSLVLQGSQPHSRFITLVGHNEYDCYRLDQTQTKIIGPKENEQRIVIVKPVLQKIPGKVCNEISTPFSYRLKIPETIENGRYLFHTRISAGSSFNRIAYLGPVVDPDDLPKIEEQASPIR